MPAKLFRPGAVFRVPVGEQDFAYAVMLAVEGYVAFYHKDAAIGENGTLDVEPMFILPVEKSAYSRRGWGESVAQIQVEKLPRVPKFFWQNIGNKWDCKIHDPVERRRTTARPEECADLEREAAWAQPHIESRIADTYAGRPNAFAESLRLKV